MNGRGRRQKGARGEREVAKILQGRRTGQMQSQSDSNEADVESGLPRWNETFHTEVKRQEKLSLDKWSAQAKADAGDKIPLVVYRRSQQPWRVSLELDDFLFLWHHAHQSETFPEAIIERFG